MLAKLASERRSAQLNFTIGESLLDALGLSGDIDVYLEGYDAEVSDAKDSAMMV